MNRINILYLLKNKPEQLILLGLLLISFYLAGVYWSGDWLKIGDAAGHLSAISAVKQHWPDIQFWNSRELLGWPQGIFYPPLFHWLSATLSFIFGVQVATKLLISFALLALPFAIYLFVSTITEKANLKGIITCIIFLGLVLFPSFLGTGIAALFQIGLLSNFFVLPFVFLYLASLHKKRYLAVGLLLGLIILTHIVAAMVAVLYIGAYLIANFVVEKRIAFWSVARAIGLALVLTAFFWLPFLLNFSYTSVSRHIASYFLPNVAVAIGGSFISLGAFYRREKTTLTLSLIATLISAIAVLDSFLIRNYGTSFILYSVHVYRYQPFSYTFFATALVLLASEINWFKKLNLTFVSLFSLLLVITAFFIQNPAQISRPNIEITQEAKVNGRFVEKFRRTEIDPYWYHIQTDILEDTNAEWAYGLFTDSTPNGPYLGSLIKSMNREAFDEEETAFIETKLIDEAKENAITKLFNINYLVTLESQDYDSLGSVEKDGKKRHFNIYGLEISNLFEVPTVPLEQISSNWDKAVEEWWTEGGELKKIPYLGNKKIDFSDPDADIMKVEILAENEDQTSFKIKTFEANEVPVIAKISYFPYWHAYAEGKEIPIYRLAPNLMLFESKGEVELVYQEPFWLKFLYMLSGISLLLLIIKRFISRQP